MLKNELWEDPFPPQLLNMNLKRKITKKKVAWLFHNTCNRPTGKYKND
jgi:hypothetical protein